MRNNEVDYEKIAPDYNLRYQQEQRQGTLSALRRILSDITPANVLELGCGTCHWLERLSEANQNVLVGIDKAHGMLKQTTKPQNLLLCQGTAENIPLRPNSFDFIYCVNALHHFVNPKHFIQQTERMLKPEGTLAIIGMNPKDPRNNWYLYDFFEGALARDLARFPEWFQVKQWLEEANFKNIQLQDIDYIHDPKTTDNVLEDPFLQKNACSQLALLSKKEYQKGLQQLQKHIKANANSGYRYENDILISMLKARKS